MQPSAPEPRTLLVVSGGRDAVPAITVARKMGLRVLVSDGSPEAPGMRVADAGLLASTHDADGTVEAARAYASRNRIDGVLSVGVHVPLTVAAVADALHLPGPSLAVAALTADRLALRARLADAGVPVPWCAEVPGADVLAGLVARSDRSLVVKPRESRGTRGVVRLLPGVDAGWAFETASAASVTGRVVVEEFIVGPQVAAEAVVCEGRPHVVGVADRTLEDGRVLAAFLVARGGECPSRLPAGTCRGVEAAVEEAVGALGLEAATVRADLVVGRDGPVVTELGIGLSGRFASTHEIPLATGVDLVGAAIRLALGETPADEALVPRWSQAVATRALFALPGAVLAVRGRAEAAAGDGIALLEVWARPGDRVGTSPVGAVVAVGETHEEAMLRADAAVARVRVLTQPAVAPPSLTVH